MKITDIKTYVVEAVRRNWIFLEVETDAGITGLGEITMEMLDKGVLGAVEDYKRLVLGTDPLAIEWQIDYLVRNKFWRGDTLSTTVLSGIEIALWDIKGKALGVPVYSLLGGPVRDRVKAYGNYWFLGPTRKDYAKTVDQYARKAAEAVERGWEALKWSPFGSAAYEVTLQQEKVMVECVRRVREAVGDRAHLLLDAHGRFNLPTAMRITRQLEEYRPFFLEEPLPPENVDAMAELKRSTTVPLATGERLITRFQFREVLTKFAVNYLQPDVIHCGGIAEMKKIAAMAEAFYIPLAPHNPCGPVATAAAIHVAASIPNFVILEYISVPEREEVLVEPLELKNGYFNLPKKPGLGVELNKKALAKFPYKDREWDHFSPVRDISL
jgi:galactonate dehydratase